ncbi:MAG: transposase [Chitinivibrionales bacterium]|nr:transposase [Chitinivibrionales bacterium]
MSEQMHRKKYDDSFKKEVVRFYSEHDQSLAAVAKNYDVTAGMLHKWVQKIAPDPGKKVFPNGNHGQEVKVLQEEVKAMRRDIGELKKIVAKTLFIKALE